MPGLMEPNPREISRKLMRRDTFIPATSLNLLAAAWIQFQTHDWFGHGRDRLRSPSRSRCAEDDDWFEKPMRVPSSKPDTTRSDDDAGLPPTYINTESHWWDASGIYGSSLERQQSVRSFKDGKLTVDGRTASARSRDRLRPDGLQRELVGRARPAAHAVRARAQRDLRRARSACIPRWATTSCSARRSSSTRRCIAKIHTVEWTPAIIAIRCCTSRMRANWWGLAEERVAPEVRPHQRERRDQRHPRIADRPPRRARISSPRSSSRSTGCTRCCRTTRDPLRSRTTALESPGVQRHHPAERRSGAARRHQGAGHLVFVRRASTRARCACTTIPRFMLRTSRCRRRASRPRRRGHHSRPGARRPALQRVPPPAAPEAACARSRSSRDNPVWAQETHARSTTATSSSVDLQIGMHAETPPPGFGFSDTAFRVFILMATRRLKSDRFLDATATRRSTTRSRDGLDRRQRHAVGARAALPGAGEGTRRRGQRVRAVEGERQSASCAFWRVYWAGSKKRS